MTNAEKYKTHHERAVAYGKFCDMYGEGCKNCPVAKIIGEEYQDWDECGFTWLELDENDLPKKTDKPVTNSINGDSDIYNPSSM